MYSPITIAHPSEGDFNPAMSGYVALAGSLDDAAGQLALQRDAVVRRFATVKAAQEGYRYAPGKWTVREVVGHMSDAERIFAYRLLRIARGDETPLPGFDENTYVPAGEFERRSLAELIEEWKAVRNATITLADGLPASAWTRRGTASGKTVTVAALAYIIVGHVEHHLKILKERYSV